MTTDVSLPDQYVLLLQNVVQENRLPQQCTSKHLNNVDWSQRKVAKVADVLRMEYMSSDESEVDEETRRVKRYVVRSFSWESRELKRAKKKLDRSHQDRFASWPLQANIHTKGATAHIGHVVSRIPIKYG